jgi:diguanylate cyclase (GGDEF)-like protein/PAS domain S-box-containing protein
MKAKPALYLFLIIEDNPGDARLLKEMLRYYHRIESNFVIVTSMAAAEAYFAKATADIILLDIGLPDAQGLAAVRRAHSAAPHVPLVVLTGLDDELLAVETLQEGAQDYLIKNELTPAGLFRALRYAIERKVIESALATQRELLQVTLQSIGDAVIRTDSKGNITFSNDVALRLTGLDAARTGSPAAEIVRMLDLNQGSPGAPQSRILHLPPDYMLMRPDGLAIPVEGCVAPVNDKDGREVGNVVVFRDVSAVRAIASQLSHSAQHDFLTGLPNRMLLVDRIGQAINLAQRSGKRLAVLFLDLDGFKHINDSLGHLLGDKLLQSVATRLVDCVRGSDTVSRQGGDEFVVLLAEMADAADAAITARRMLEAVRNVHRISGNDLHVSTSIGVSVYPDDGTDSETLIKNADTAMYQAKENGRHRYQFFEPAMKVRALERQYIEENLRLAFDRNEFSLNYQPKINIKTGIITGAEALIRWKHPVRGLISPAQFIPVAEDCGLIRRIGAWVLREACTQARAWSAAGLPPIMIAVNVSAIEFRHENYLANLLAILAETGLDPKQLELELTEGILMKAEASTHATFSALRARGVRLAIDDFGTGYSSLSYLTKFPIDTLKIDQSFIRQISASPSETGIVTAVIGMARSLNLAVVAEGVETQEQLKFLSTQHCDEAQGYFFSRPVAGDAFARSLTSGVPAKS